MGQPKIATCCYCGTRAALVLRGDVRHELSCSACGAPLHDLKSLPVDKVNRTPPAPAPAPAPAQARAQPARSARPKRRKRKSLSRRVLSEVIDLIEDILD